MKPINFFRVPMGILMLVAICQLLQGSWRMPSGDAQDSMMAIHQDLLGIGFLLAAMMLHLFGSAVAQEISARKP